MAARVNLFFLAALGVLLAACQSLPVGESGTAYLVRHAEKVTADSQMIVDDPNDPQLTPDGEVRAEALADRLIDADIAAIWSTDTTRTRSTAAPLAERLGLDVQIYDASDLPAFAAQLKTKAGSNVLVVGHSNTTPALAEALGADPGAPIVEKGENDRLYVIDLSAGTGEIQRYGAASVY
ncbi:MAG: phosphoglycerate mutase family protein [Pseudomonadota bacterium]